MNDVQFHPVGNDDTQNVQCKFNGNKLASRCVFLATISIRYICV